MSLGKVERRHCLPIHFPESLSPASMTVWMKDSELEWLAKDHPETNLLTTKPWDCEPPGRAVLLGSLTLLLSTRVPFPIKSLALSAHVSPQTIHFRVLDKSPVSAPEGVPRPATVLLILECTEMEYVLFFYLASCQWTSCHVSEFILDEWIYMVSAGLT